MIAGLGNPGPWFGGTRHNAGFMVVDRLAERHGAKFKWLKARCRVAEIEAGNRHFVLAKPQWFMNSSGSPIAAVMRRCGVPAGRLVVVHDELDFRFGAARMKRGGGSGGHNGLRSVSKVLGTSDYTRLRFGIGRPPKGEKVGSFVMKNFSTIEQTELSALLERCADTIEALVTHGLDKAQTELRSAEV
ncbi:aminoacyl-tRNA hydrolase [Streptomyces ehimensis]|uniref:Peptidyl-tRNA hydrolase n=1 Tax=Streptomyces ehimensis TaxID=68195 RepID=A0ABV9BUF8_9ACTN